MPLLVTALSMAFYQNRCVQSSITPFSFSTKHKTFLRSRVRSSLVYSSIDAKNWPRTNFIPSIFNMYLCKIYAFINQLPGVLVIRVFVFVNRTAISITYDSFSLSRDIENNFTMINRKYKLSCKGWAD